MRFTLILVFLASLVGFFLTLLLVSTNKTANFDRAGIELVQSFSSPFLTWIMVFVSAFGNGVFTVFTFFAFAFALLLKGYRRQSHFSFLIWLALLLSWLAKWAVVRPRPEGYLIEQIRMPSDFSFPSGHVVFYTVFFGLVAFSFPVGNFSKPRPQNSSPEIEKNSAALAPVAPVSTSSTSPATTSSVPNSWGASFEEMFGFSDLNKESDLLGKTGTGSSTGNAIDEIFKELNQ